MKATAETNQKTWIHRFPWCRQISEYQQLVTPPGTGRPEEGGYPPMLLQYPLLLDEERFIRILRVFWSIEVTPFDLNALEFFGLVIPVRKALTEDLRRVDRGELNELGVTRTGPLYAWHHPLRPISDSPRSSGTPTQLCYKHFGDWREFNDFNLSRMRPTPVLCVATRDLLQSIGVPPDLVEPDDQLRSARRRQPIEALEGRTCYTFRELRNLGLWLRPSDPRYWACLARIADPATAPTQLSRSTPRWLSNALGDPQLNPFRLTPEAAMRGNHQVTRFYVAGGRANWLPEYLNRNPLEFRKLGQDWWTVQAILRLRGRADLGMRLELESAVQGTGPNFPKQPVNSFARRWRIAARGAHERLPPLHASFHRDVLMLLTHKGRPKGISASESMGSLCKLTGLKHSGVETAFNRARELLSTG